MTCSTILKDKQFGLFISEKKRKGMEEIKTYNETWEADMKITIYNII
ncbi:MAG: hypothetical protein Q8M71_11290 [Thermodesulfovibrionales bacterium]|nr:hypothetical protein [Thermodesulfovibrionales bacterium]